MLSGTTPTKSSSGQTELMLKRDSSLMTTKVVPLLNSLHNDPRFAALLEKLNLPN